MHLRINCGQCLWDERHSNITASLPQAIELTDSRAYIWRCERDHKNQTQLLAEKYEILFDIAVSAISHGFYREAVSSFSASLERFYELWVRRGLAAFQAPPDAATECWKNISKQSERQFGAFTAVYTCATRKCPVLIPEKLRGEFRNNVIHRGIIPTRDEAINFGQSIIDVIGPQISELIQICGYDNLLEAVREMG